MASSSSSPKPFSSKPLHNFDLHALHALKWNSHPKPTNRCRSSSAAAAVKSPTQFVVAVAGVNEGRGGGDGKEEEKVVTRLDVALNKVDIDDDKYTFFLTKNTKRPRKRHMSVQKKLDCLFPGLGLINITPETYKVLENDRKG